MHKSPSMAAVGAVSLALLQGCAGLSPQIFSEHLQVVQGEDGRYKPLKASPPANFDEVYNDVAFVQKRYVSAAQAQSNATPQLGAALIGATTAGVVYAVDGGSSKGLAGLAGVMAGAYAAGNTLISRPRADVYRAGASALQCALNASEPFRQGQAVLGRLGEAPGAATLHGLRSSVHDKQESLRAVVDAHAAAERRLDKVVDVPARPASCPAVQRAACPPPPANATPQEAEALERTCRERDARARAGCRPAQAERSHTVPPPPPLRAAFAAARSEIDAAERARRRAQRAIDALQGAGPALWARSVEIQLKVSEEVDKTVPSLASVMDTVKGLAGSAAGFADAMQKPPPAVGGAEGAATSVRALDAEEQALVARLEKETAELRTLRVRLDDLAAGAVGNGHAQARKALQNCAVRVDSSTLRVSPEADAVDLPVGSTQSFFIAGSGSVPVAEVEIDGRRTPLKVQVEGGQFRVDYTATGVKPGDTVLVILRDRSAFEHAVAVHITEANAVGATPEAAGAAALPAALPAASRPPLTLDRDTLAKMGLAPDADQAAIYAVIDRCQRQGAAPVTGVFDKATQQAVAKGSCKAA